MTCQGPYAYLRTLYTELSTRQPFFLVTCPRVSDAMLKGTKRTISYVIRDPEEKWNRSGVNALQIDCTNCRLYTGGRDSIIRAWDVQPNRDPPRYINSLEHHTDWINDIVLCQHGKKLFSASSDATLKLWESLSGQCIATLRTHKDYVKALAYSPETEMAASAGLENQIFFWDLNALSNLTVANNTITTSSFSGNTSSVYSLAMDRGGHFLASGSSDKIIRIWDTKSLQKLMELRGHTDNIRTLAMSNDGALLLSGSTDGTIRLWSVAQQCCIETYRLHDEGVWTVVADSTFSNFYSSGRDKQVFATNLKSSTSKCLFSEDAPVLKLLLDPVDPHPSLWVATMSTHINKWPIVSNLTEEEESEEMVTDLDSMDMGTKSVTTIPGGPCLKEYRILNNKREILTKDSQGNVTLWSILLAKKLEDLGQVDLDEEVERRSEQVYCPNWFGIELKTGMLTVRLEENDCFSLWELASRSGIPDIPLDLNLNIGALCLKALYEHWPEACTNQNAEDGDDASSISSGKSLSNRKFFSVPPHTPIYIAEAGDCGCTLARLHCSDAARQHEASLLQQHSPLWIIDCVVKGNLPKYLKISFSAGPHSESFLAKQPSAKEEHLQAPDFLPVSRIIERVYTHQYGPEGKVNHRGERIEPKDQFVIYCQGQLIDPEMDFRTVRYYFWKSSSEIKFYYAYKHDDKVGTKAEDSS